MWKLAPDLAPDGRPVAHHVDLVQQDDVGEGNLLDGLVDGVLGPLLAEVVEAVFGVDHGDDAIQVDVAAELLVHPEDGGHRGGVGQPRRLQEDVVELALLLHEGLDRLHAVVFDGAAEAPVAQLKPLFVQLN